MGRWKGVWRVAFRTIYLHLPGFIPVLSISPSLGSLKYLSLSSSMRAPTILYSTCRMNLVLTSWCINTRAYMRFHTHARTREFVGKRLSQPLREILTRQEGQGRKEEGQEVGGSEKADIPSDRTCSPSSSNRGRENGSASQALLTWVGESSRTWRETQLDAKKGGPQRRKGSDARNMCQGLMGRGWEGLLLQVFVYLHACASASVCVCRACLCTLSLRLAYGHQISSAFRTLNLLQRLFSRRLPPGQPLKWCDFVDIFAPSGFCMTYSRARTQITVDELSPYHISRCNRTSLTHIWYAFAPQTLHMRKRSIQKRNSRPHLDHMHKRSNTKFCGYDSSAEVGYVSYAHECKCFCVQALKTGRKIQVCTFTFFNVIRLYSRIIIYLRAICKHISGTFPDAHTCPCSLRSYL
jgi:hypothetical protein